MWTRILAAVGSLAAALALLGAPPAQAADQSDCAFNTAAFGPFPSPTATPGTSVPKFTFKGPSTVALGNRYAFTFTTTPADADGILYLQFGNGESFRWGRYAQALNAKVVDGKVLDANGRPVDVPMLRVHPNLTYPGRTVYLWASFRDLATGQYICKKYPVTVTG